MPLLLQNNLRLILLVLLLALGWLYLHSDRQESYYEQTALPQLPAMFTELSQWQTASFRKHLSSEASQSISDDQLHQLLEQYRPLGAFKNIRLLSFSKLASALSVFGTARISYQGVVEFEAGARDITVTLVQEGERFAIYNLNIKL